MPSASNFFRRDPETPTASRKKESRPPSWASAKEPTPNVRIATSGDSTSIAPQRRVAGPHVTPIAEFIPDRGTPHKTRTDSVATPTPIAGP